MRNPPRSKNESRKEAINIIKVFLQSQIAKYQTSTYRWTFYLNEIFF